MDVIKRQGYLVKFEHKKIKMAIEKAMSETKDGIDQDLSGDISLKIQGGREMKRRLMEMGVIKGEIIQLVGVAPFGDPLEFAINDFKLFLRLKKTNNITVELLEE